MEKEYKCEYCGKEVKQDEIVRNGRFDEPHYDGEAIWHLECYEKEHDEARERGFV